MTIGNPDEIAAYVMSFDIAMPAHATVEAVAASADVTLAI